MVLEDRAEMEMFQIRRKARREKKTNVCSEKEAPIVKNQFDITISNNPVSLDL